MLRAFFCAFEGTVIFIICSPLSLLSHLHLLSLSCSLLSSPLLSSPLPLLFLSLSSPLLSSPLLSSPPSSSPLSPLLPSPRLSFSSPLLASPLLSSLFSSLLFSSLSSLLSPLSSLLFLFLFNCALTPGRGTVVMRIIVMRQHFQQGQLPADSVPKVPT